MFLGPLPVLNEARRIMGPHGRLRPSPIHYDPSAFIKAPKNSRSKNLKLKAQKPILKNLTVLEYNPAFKDKFTKKFATIIMSGIVEFRKDDTEDDIRQSIASVIGCKPDEFQFLKRSGHVFTVPNFAADFDVNMSAIATLCGQGDVYVRLNQYHKDIITSKPSDGTTAPSTYLSQDHAGTSFGTGTSGIS